MHAPRTFNADAGVHPSPSCESARLMSPAGPLVQPNRRPFFVRLGGDRERAQASRVTTGLSAADGVAREWQFFRRQPLLLRVVKGLVLPWRNSRFASMTLRAPVDAPYVFIVSHAGAGFQCLLPVVYQLDQAGIRVLVLVAERVAATIRERLPERVPIVIVPDPLRAHRSLLWLSYRRYLLDKFATYEHHVRMCLESLDRPVVINHADFTVLGSAAISCARALSIPEVTVQHGAVSEEFFPVLTSHYLVWGNHAAEQIAGQVPTPRLSVVGAPMIDANIGSAPADRRDTRLEMRVRLGIHDHQRLVVFMSNSHSGVVPHSTHDAALALAVSSGGKSDVVVMRRRHPQERGRDLWPPRGLPVIEQMSLLEVLLAADLVVGVCSSTLVESLAFGVPSRQVLPQGHLGPRWPCLPHHLTVRSSADLICAAQGKEDEESGLCAARRQLLANPGRSGQEMLTLLSGLRTGRGSG